MMADRIPPPTAITVSAGRNSGSGIHSVTAPIIFTSPPPIAPIANSAAKTRKTAKAAANWIGISGHGARSLAIQKGIASSAIAALSSLEIVRDRKSLIAAATINMPSRSIKPREIVPLSIGFPLRIMAYQRVTMVPDTRSLHSAVQRICGGHDRCAAFRHRCADCRRRDRGRQPGRGAGTLAPRDGRGGGGCAGLSRDWPIGGLLARKLWRGGGAAADPSPPREAG